MDESGQDIREPNPQLRLNSMIEFLSRKTFSVEAIKKNLQALINDTKF